MESIANNKRSREVVDLPEDESLHNAKRIREELIINILEDDDDAGDRDHTTQDLDTVIKSLQEEITPVPSPQSNDLIPQPDLGYLLEASDDELGLPPAEPSPSEECGGSEDENAGFAPIWGYEDEAFDLGFVAIDEPFGFNDALCEPFDLFGGDYPDLVF
ncbi:hypothetical protein IHE45_04G089500 [Dioscorea alata]|uniref:Uncharacterized protein n=1 Tax=Dioscorea alata TaxID=55571 RepID=A0ACB7WEI8_DIOAL|nr:hypothetical protein IHE45_04G089500 [Dioscorea alata]